MISMVLAAMALGAAEPAVLWLAARDIDPEGVAIAHEGTYWVWAWAPGDAAVEVTVDGEKFAPKKKEKSEARYVWRKAGKRSLGAGKVRVELAEAVAAVVLTTDTRFAPGQAMGDRRVTDQPEPVRDRRAEIAHHTLRCDDEVLVYGVNVEDGT